MKIEIIIPETNLRDCKHCNEPFIAARKDKKYCSNSCKQKAYIKRHALVFFTPSLNTELNNPQQKDGFIKRFLKLLW